FALTWYLRFDPTIFKSFIYNGTFNPFYRNRCSIYLHYARLFTWCRTYASSKFWEVICLVQPFICCLEVLLVHYVIPFRHVIPNRTTSWFSPMCLTCLTKWCATIHASRTLF